MLCSKFAKTSTTGLKLDQKFTPFLVLAELLIVNLNRIGLDFLSWILSNKI